MRMSYWSSDVCSSDLDQVLDQQIILSRHPAVGGPGDRPDREHAKAIASQPRPAIERDHHGRYRSEEHTSELQSLMSISYAVCCLKKKTKIECRMWLEKRNKNNTNKRIKHK